MLANEGFVIVSINYELASGEKYPAPIIQLGEAYTFIENSGETYPFIDKDSVYFGGDSAGAHIASQFITIQTNSDYLSLLNTFDQTMDVKKVVQKDITGAILFAGPYDFEALSNLVKGRSNKNESSILSSAISFLAKRIGQAYLGDRNWKQNEDYAVLSITNYVSATFPRTFITDGRTFSFEDHARTLEENLISKGVDVTSVYYDFDLAHEYQFNLGTNFEDGNNYAQMTFNKLLEFLNK